MIGAATAIGAAAPAAAVTSLNDNLTAMAAVSASDAWAVGTYQARGWAQTLIEHWDGTAWTVTARPDPGGPAANSFLYAVAAASASSAWAVGSYRKGGAWHALIEHWDGDTWKQVPSPGPAGPGSSTHLPNTALYGVAVISAADVWAVGKYRRGAATRALIVHWNGTTWTQMASPRVGSSHYDVLYGIAALSSARIWAAGVSGRPSGRTLIERWNGRSWTTAASPRPGSFGDGYLYGVIALSARDVWAAGNYQGGGGSLTLVEHWNGTRWRQVPSPSR